jgi:hypothetical protein
MFERAYRIREEINTHIYKASLLISLLEFIEKSGASTVELYEELGKINRMKLTAEEYVRMDDHDSASDVFDEILYSIIMAELCGGNLSVQFSSNHERPEDHAA